MGAEKGIPVKKAEEAMETKLRGPRLPWPLLAGQLGGQLQVHNGEWTGFGVFFPQSQTK